MICSLSILIELYCLSSKGIQRIAYILNLARFLHVSHTIRRCYPAFKYHCHKANSSINVILANLVALLILWILFVICVSCLSLSYCLVCSLQPCLTCWEGLTSWFSCVWCLLIFLSLSHMVSYVRCGTWLYRVLTMPSFLLCKPHYLRMIPFFVRGCLVTIVTKQMVSLMWHKITLFLKMLLAFLSRVCLCCNKAYRFINVKLAKSCKSWYFSRWDASSYQGLH